jgi:hypothetical protein
MMTTLTTFVGSTVPERRPNRATMMAALALAALGGMILMPEIALAATSRPPKSLWSAFVQFSGMTLFFLGLPGLALVIYLAIRRSWVVIGLPVLAVAPLSAIFQWQNPAIASLPGKLFAVAGTLLAVGLLAAAGIGLAKSLIREASRIGVSATALAVTLPFALGMIGPLCGSLVAKTVSQSSPEQAFTAVAGSVAIGLLALVFPLASFSRSVAATTIGTSAGLILLPLWSVAVSNAVDAGQGAILIFLVIPLIPMVWLTARVGAKLAGNRQVSTQTC